jgi:hypothetical protein
MITPNWGVTKVCTGTRHPGCPTSMRSSNEANVHRAGSPDRSPRHALTNQVPSDDVGDMLDVCFAAPALRTYGPDRPPRSRPRHLTAQHSTGMPICAGLARVDTVVRAWSSVRPTPWVGDGSPRALRCRPPARASADGLRYLSTRRQPAISPGRRFAPGEIVCASCPAHSSMPRVRLSGRRRLLRHHCRRPRH